MRLHRHQRQAIRAAKQDQLEAISLAPRVEKPVLGVRADGKMINLGFRTSPSMKQSHSVRIHFSPMGDNANADQSLTSKQLQIKYRPR